MKKWVRLFALLLALGMFCMTGISAAATEPGASADGGGQEENGDGESSDHETNGSGDGGTEEVKTPYPAGTGAIAAEPAYTYKIRIFSGKQGVFGSGKTEEENGDGETDGEDVGTDNAEGTVGGADGTGEETEDGEGAESGEASEPAGKTMIEIELDPSAYAGNPQVILNYGELVNSVQLKDGSKYYVMGIRESGRDNKTVGAITITGDRDYVVAYGIRGKMVNYTVEFVNESGESLAPAQTYEGKVGDKPVVAYLYIDGYRPQAYNLTKTLEEDESENVFRFVYSPATTPAGTVTGSGGEYVTIIDNGTVFINNGMGAGGPMNVEDGGTIVVTGDGAGGAGGAAAEGGAGGEVIEDEPTPLGEPEQLIDLDDEEVPLAGNGIFGIDGNASLLGIPLPVVGVIVLLIAGSLWFAFVYMKKKKKETES